MPLKPDQDLPARLEETSVVMHYHVKEEILKVWFTDGRCKIIPYTVPGVSGGGRGCDNHEGGGGKRKWVAHRYGILGNRRYCYWDPETRRDSRIGLRGGPIPSGLYRVEEPKHNIFHESDEKAEHVYSSALIPYSWLGHPVISRAGFYIHGQGSKGSDGCIVPVNPLALTVFQWIKPLIHARGAGWLFVSDQDPYNYDFIIHKIFYHRLAIA